jgi:hypothetical protein
MQEMGVTGRRRVRYAHSDDLANRRLPMKKTAKVLLDFLGTIV